MAKYLDNLLTVIESPGMSRVKEVQVMDVASGGNDLGSGTAVAITKMVGFALHSIVVQDGKLMIRFDTDPS